MELNALRKMVALRRANPSAKIEAMGELRYNAEAFDDWSSRFFKRFLDRLESSEVISPETFDSSFLVEINKTISDNTIHVTRSTVIATGRTENVVVPTINLPELCAGIAFLAFEDRAD